MRPIEVVIHTENSAKTFGLEEDDVKRLKDNFGNELSSGVIQVHPVVDRSKHPDVKKAITLINLDKVLQIDIIERTELEIPQSRVLTFPDGTAR